MSIISQAPYYDDFAVENNFLHVLWNPERPVQARELTGLGSILKNQIGTHAKHTFKEGTPVIGGQITAQRISFAVLNSTGSFPVVLEEWLGKKVIEKTTADVETGYEGNVVKIKETADGQKIIFFDSKVPFTAGNIVSIDGENISGSVAESNNTFFLGVDEGIFFINDQFVNVAKQSIILEDKNTTPTGVAGIVWTEKVVTASDDVSLLDPARGSTNYGSAGADRLKYETVLTYVKDGDDLPENFVQVYEIRDGETKSITNVTKYSDLAKELARRTYDESGNYTVNPFPLVLGDGIKNKIASISTTGVIRTVITHEVLVGDSLILSAEGTNRDVNVTEIIDQFQFKVDYSPATALSGAGMTYKDEAEFSIELGKGKAYVRGFEIEKISSSELALNRARDRQSVDNYNIVPVFGNYIIVTSVVGFLNSSTAVTLNLRDASNAIIGTAKVLFFRYHSGSKGQADAKYRLYLSNLTFNAGKSLSLVKSVSGGTAFTATVAADSINLQNETYLAAAASGSLIYEIPQSGVATLMPGGVSSTSYTTHSFFSGAATGSNVSFSIGAGSESQFYGPTGTNFAGTDIERQLYQFVNTSTNQVLDVTSITILNAGKQLNVVFGSAGGNVSALVPTQLATTTPKTKIKRTGTIVAPAGGVSTTKAFSLGKVDIIELTSAKVEGVEIKEKFILDNGQRDSSYDLGTVIVRPSATIDATKTITFEFSYFEHSGNGYFSVDSYTGIDYADIPAYTSKSTGRIFQLSDVLDFRVAATGAALPIPNVPIAADYEFYLPRRDAVVLYETGVFGIVEGRSEINPQYPKIPDDAMVLYYLDIPAYTKTGHDCQTRYVDNKRYTMRDIGRLEKRIDRLEYYTALTLLEMDTKNKTIYDENGMERFKNGFLVDSFTGHGIGNVNNADYKCAVDQAKNILRPAFDSANVKLTVQTKTSVRSNDHSKEKVGEIITLPYTEETFLWNNLATKSESVNPFLVTDTIGWLSSNPPSDDWVDTTTAPAVMVNLEGDLDAWEALTSAIQDMAPGFGTQWDSWETTWSGSSTNTVTRGTASTGTSTTTTTTTTTDQIRSGTQTTLGTERIESSIGEYVTDVNLAYYMRAVSIAVHGEGLRANRDLHVFFDEENINDLVVPASGYAPTREGVAKSDSNGEVKLTINIPAGTFRTGERLITVIDDIQGNKDNATTYGTYVFTASGLQQTVRESVISTRVPTVDVTTVTDSRTVVSTSSRTTTTRPIRTNDGGDRGNGGGRDPLAQTFFVSAESYPAGIFVTSAGVYIRNKPVDASFPLQVQLRTVTNGYPDSSNIIPFSNVFVPHSQVKLPSNTADMASILNAETLVPFDAPIYLEPGKEYALILLSGSDEYEAYIAVMGQTVFGTNTVISAQISLGSMFKSQNSSTWTAFQNEDLMMRLNKAVFPVNTPGVVTFNAKAEKPTYISQFTHNLEPINFSNITSISSRYSIKNSSNLVQGAFVGYDLKKQIIPNTERVILENTDFVSELTLNTTYKDVSPFIDTTRNSLITVHNQINNLGIVASGFDILNGGTGFTSAPTITVNGNGFGAVVEGVLTSGRITGIKIVDPGQNYTQVTGVVVSGGGGTGAVITYGGFETDANGGNALARYITRNVALKEGFETDYITVTMDINKRYGTDILLYYRAKSADDSGIIESKKWIPMKQATDTQIISGSEDEFTEVDYVPTTSTIEYTENGYTYKKANIVAIKIVMLSTDTSVVPLIKNLRVVTSVT